MSKKLLVTMLVSGVLGLAQQVAWADPTCEKTFQPQLGNTGDWTDPDNWNPAGKPTSTDVACIPAGKTAEIITDHGVAEALWIKTDAINGPGRLEVLGDAYLLNPADITIFGDSQIDGHLVLMFSGTLIIDGTITIDGKGQIRMVPEFVDVNLPTIVCSDPVNTSGPSNPLWDCSASTDQLTLNGINAGAWTPEEWDDRTDTLVVTGGGQIDVELVNNAHVVTKEEEGPFTGGANYNDRELTINGSASGNGFWIAELNANPPGRVDVGILDIKSSVTGSATWVVAGNGTVSMEPEIRINSPLTSLTGDVLVYGGTLLIKQNFETTGDLTLQDQLNPEIIVRSPRTAKFNGP
jgi:hypothetical protein